MMYNDFYFNHMYGWGGLIGGGLMMVVFWGLIIWLIVALIRGTRYDNSSHRHREKSALDILKERYAKGEINKEEFEEKKKHLVE